MPTPASVLAVLGLVLATASGTAWNPNTMGHPAAACSPPFHVWGAEWDLCWQQDDARGQGLELNQVYFHGEPVLWKVGLPFSLTRYEDDAFGPFKDILGIPTFGVNHGLGLGSIQIHPADCPRFLTSGVLLNDRRVCVEHRGGPEPAVALWARYDNFNYRFLQGYHLDARGVFEPFLRLGGTLIDHQEAPGAKGASHLHHVYWRVDFAVGDPSQDEFQVFLRPDEDWTPFGHLGDLPPPCKQQIRDLVTGWCGIKDERRLLRHEALFSRWRVVDSVELNPKGNERSFEFTTRPDGPPDGEFATFDALVVEHKGDSSEIGFEVPFFPVEGDAYIAPYYAAGEFVTDPVVWVAVHAFHLPRDEDHPTVTYHHLSFTVQPRNFLDGNRGEDSYDPRPFPPVDLGT